MKETLEEFSIIKLSGRRVGIMNIHPGHYLTPEGQLRSGLVVVLSVDGTRETVMGQGSTIVIGRDRWELAAIDRKLFANGVVTFVPAGKADADEIEEVEPEDIIDLDWIFAHECPKCKSLCGWTGNTESMHGDVMLVMYCLKCEQRFSWVSRHMQALLQSQLPTFEPGRSAPETED